MVQIQGVLLCSGNGSRFAKSVGRPAPYPKHLEMLGERSVLSRAVDSLVQNTGVSGISFTLNPLLQNQYVTHLRMLQQDYPAIPFTFMRGGAGNLKVIPSEIRQGMKNAYDLSGQKVAFGNPLVALSFGDSVVKLEEEDGIKQLIEESYLHNIFRNGKNIYIGQRIGGLKYILSHLQSMSTDIADILIRFGSEYGMRAWNINTKQDLLGAKYDLGYPLTEEERVFFEGRPGREHF